MARGKFKPPPGRDGAKKGKGMNGALKRGSGLPKKSNASNKEGRVADAKNTFFRSGATIRRLNMYNKKPEKLEKRREEKLAPVRIQPDRRWFGNTRVITQDKMTKFREELSKSVQDPFQVVLKSSKLPMSLLKENTDKVARMKLLSVESFSETFGKKKQRKRPKLASFDFEQLAAAANKKNEKYEEGKDKQLVMNMNTGYKKEELFNKEGHAKEEIFDKGTSKRIWGELYKVVDSSDILLMVLDARDPMGTRCLKLEREVRRNHPNKHIVLLLNKCDLIPTWATRAWVRTLQKEFPCLACHASITNPFGKAALLQLLRQFGVLLKDRKHVSIGLVGYPNVGKSSVINMLKKKKVCKAAPIPGETKVWQYVSLTKKLYMIDCPGVVPPSSSDFSSDCAKVLKGVVRAEKVEAPSQYMDEVLSRVKRRYLLEKYKLPPKTTWEDGEDFLTVLGRKMGKLFKGAQVDIETTAKSVLYDWQRGRIPFFTPPPRDAAEEEATKKKQEASEGLETEGKQATGSENESSSVQENGSSTSSTATAGEEKELVEQVKVEVEQDFEDLQCSMEYDEEDRRGEKNGADTSSGNKKRKRDTEGSGDVAGDKAQIKKKKKKKARRGGGGGNLTQVKIGAGAGQKKAEQGTKKVDRGKPEAPDWSAVNAEFAA